MIDDYGSKFGWCVLIVEFPSPNQQLHARMQACTFFHLCMHACMDCSTTLDSNHNIVSVPPKWYMEGDLSYIYIYTYIKDQFSVYCQNGNHLIVYILWITHKMGPILLLWVHILYCTWDNDVNIIIILSSWNFFIMLARLYRNLLFAIMVYNNFIFWSGLREATMPEKRREGDSKYLSSMQRSWAMLIVSSVNVFQKTKDCAQLIMVIITVISCCKGSLSNKHSI